MSQIKPYTYHVSYIVFMTLIWLALTPILIGFAVLLYIPGLLKTKITAGEKSLSIKSGWMVESNHEIPYTKINNVEATTQMWSSFGNIKIYVWHNKPLVYSSIQNVKSLKKDIMNHLA